jgi:hypothetical protein
VSSSPFHYGGAPTGVAVASASAPSLDEGAIVKLSVDLSNNLRTTGGGGGGGGTSSEFGDPFPADGTAAGFNDPSGNMAAGNLDADGKLLVSASPAPITSATPNDPVQSALTGTAAQALPANPARLWVAIQNFGGEPLYYLFGSVAQTGAISSTNCSGFLLAGEKAFLLCGAQIITSVIQWCSTVTGTTGNIQDGEA